MSDCVINTLSLLGKSIGIDSENYLFGKLKSDHFQDFPKLIDRSNFNRPKKRLGSYITKFIKVSLGLSTRVRMFIWWIQFQYLYGRLYVKNLARFVKKIMKQLQTKFTLQLANPGTLDINFTWLPQSMVYFPAWILLR